MVRALARHPCPTHASVRSLYEAAPRLLMRSGAKSRTGLGAFPSVVALDSLVRGFGSVAIPAKNGFATFCRRRRMRVTPLVFQCLRLLCNSDVYIIVITRRTL
jgi:hypothetical protein